MPKEKKSKPTDFTVLPTEIVFAIFDFLTAHDILRAFAHLNDRYDASVREYIKRLDLTENWHGNRQEFDWIFWSIHTLKINQYHTHLLNDPDDQENVTSSSIKYSLPQRKGKSLLSSIINKFFTRSFKMTRSSQSYLNQGMPVAGYRFPQLHTLHLSNVSNWNKMVSGMNLKSLSLWFDDDNPYHCEEGVIPQTVIRFSANTVFEANNFHTNLIVLNVCVRSVVHLIEIVEHTPNIQHLYITFADNFGDDYRIEKYQSDHFKTMTTNFRPLSHLSYLSFSTKSFDNAKSNEHLQFNQMTIFIDQCCPDKDILKRVTLKLEYIMVGRNMWPTIVQYKNTFDCFNFYGSFIEDDRASINIIISSINDHFAFHIEDGDPLHAQARFVHIYSLPFTFDKLHGFISCSELSPRCSFSSVRHLYFTQTRLVRPVSFQSLARHMPHLISISCNLLLGDGYNGTVTEVIDDFEILNHVRSFRFIIRRCFGATGLRYTPRLLLLPALLDQLPHLQRLIASGYDLVHVQHPLSSIKWLDLREGELELVNTLPQRVPHLSTLLLDYILTYGKAWPRLIGSLFLRLPSLKLVCFYNSSRNNTQQMSRKQIAKMLARMQNMDKRLRHLRLDYRYRTVEISFRNL